MDGETFEKGIIILLLYIVTWDWNPLWRKGEYRDERELGHILCSRNFWAPAYS